MPLTMRADRTFECPLCLPLLTSGPLPSSWNDSMCAHCAQRQRSKSKTLLLSNVVASRISPICFAPLQTTSHGGVVGAPWFRCSAFGFCDGHGRAQVIQRRAVAHDTMVRSRLFKEVAERKHSLHSHKLLPCVGWSIM
jgi:hypothetical protein